MRHRQIDPDEAERLFDEGRSWRHVTEILSRGLPAPFHIESVKMAVYRERKRRAAEGQNGG